jgi:diguanylate cyclase (GGDEF)-like protein/PAS domain S-box-containing protein
MTPLWNWTAPAVLAILAIYQQLRVSRIHRASKKREELFQVVTENAADMIALVDMKGHRLYNSPAYKRILGYSTAELGETSSYEQIHPDDRFPVMEAAREARSTGVGKKLNYRIRHKDGTWRVLESLAGTIRDEKGEVAKLVIVSRDITDRRRAEELAEHNSFHDGLTGLPNRRLFLDRLHNLFERTKRNPDRRYAVLFVDLDGFKIFNDTMGPALGDQVIIEMGRRLDSCLREEDTVSRSAEAAGEWNAILSRMGGDEFSVLLEGITDSSDALRVSQRILSAIATPVAAEGREVRASASVGIALSTATHRRAEESLQEANVAMRRAKALRGSRCEIFDEDMQTSAANRLKLESELREAIAQSQFRLYYQPIVELKSGRSIGLEALLRWQHPQQGLISPYKFIAAAEDTGLLVTTGHWVLREACTRLREWSTEIHGMEALSMSVNISARQLADVHFIPHLKTTLETTGIEPSQLYLEINERVAAADAKLNEAVFSQLKTLRVRLILDDFGTGNSSLSGLQKMPAQALKIDRSLVGAMLLDHNASQTVELIMLLAKKLKLKVIAEGVESAKQLVHLQQLGCELGQGFLFSPPVEAQAINALLRKGNAVRLAKVAGVPAAAGSYDS